MPKQPTKKKSPRKSSPAISTRSYSAFINSIARLVAEARHRAARSVDSLLTATYWEIGRRIVEFDQKGSKRAGYGDELMVRLSADLTERFGRGFAKANLYTMRAFYDTYRDIFQTPSGESVDYGISQSFALPWSAYVRLLSVQDPHARKFYETEAVTNGWSVRQLDRQIGSQFYERTALSRNKARMLKSAATPAAERNTAPEEAIKDPYILEFLDLKDEYSESDLEDALIKHLEHFLLELGGDFAFIGRQKRLRIGDQWYRIDLLFFHRRLRCLVVIDLKLGKFSHADAGQMHVYLNYAREHWAMPDENPPVGLILCAEKNDALAKYALEGLPNKVMAARYRTALPDPKQIEQELQNTRRMLHSVPSDHSPGA